MRTRRWWPRPGLLRQQDYLRLWSAQTISHLGSGVSGLALPLTAVRALGATAGEMGLLRAAGGAPALLLSLLAGVWVDRLRRRPVLIAADLGQAALLAAIPLAAALGMLRMELLYVVGFLGGTLALCFNIAMHAYVPALVRREDLVEGNAKLQASFSTTRVAGPGAAGWLVQAVGAPLALLADALSFLVSCALIASIRTVEPTPARSAAGRNAWREIREGTRTLWGEPVVRATTITATVGALGTSMQQTIFVLYATAELGLAPVWLGAIFAVAGVAALVGAVGAAPLARWRGAGGGLVLGQSLIPLGSVLLPVASAMPAAAVPLLAVGQVVIAVGMTLYSVLNSSLRQTVAERRVLGRVEATRRFVVFGIQPIGALVAGALGAALGLAPALVVAAGIQAAAVVVLLRSPIPRLGPPATAAVVKS